MLLPSTRRATSNEIRTVLSCGLKSQSIASKLPSLSINTAAVQRLTNCYSLSPLSSTPRRLNFTTTASIRQEEEQQDEEGKKEMDDGEKNIYDILTRTFEPKMLQVSDVSGTYSTRSRIIARKLLLKSSCSLIPLGGCGSFYAIVIASSHFNGKPTVKAHRLVNEALKEVIAGIHGLQVRRKASF